MWIYFKVVFSMQVFYYSIKDQQWKNGTYKCVGAIPRVLIQRRSQFHQYVHNKQCQVSLGQIELVVCWLKTENITTKISICDSKRYFCSTVSFFKIVKVIPIMMCFNLSLLKLPTDFLALLNQIKTFIVRHMNSKYGLTQNLSSTCTGTKFWQRIVIGTV